MQRVVAVARTCGARFTIANTPDWQLPSLFQLAVLAQADSLAQAIVAARVARAPTPAAKLQLWREALEIELEAQPPRRAAAQAMIAKLDQQLAGDMPAQIALHQELLVHDAEGQDTAGVRREAERMIALVDTQSVVHASDYGLLREAYRELYTLTFFEHPDSMAVLEARERATLTRLMTPALHLEILHQWGHKTDDMTVQQVLALQLKDLVPTWITRLPTPQTPPLRIHGDYWFPAPGQPARDTVRPVRGKVNLVCVGGFPDLTTHYDDRNGGRFALGLRRWLAHYGPQGAIVTMVAIVSDSTGNTLGEFAPTAAQAAQFWRWYYQDYEQLPVAVAVQVRPQGWVTMPDGRRLWEGRTVQWDNIADEGGGTFHDTQCALLDPEGKVANFTSTSAEGVYAINASGDWFDRTVVWLLRQHQLR